MKHDTTMEERFKEQFNFKAIFGQNSRTEKELLNFITAELTLARVDEVSTCDERIKQAVRDRKDIVTDFWNDDDIKKYVVMGNVCSGLALAITAKLTRLPPPRPRDY